LTVFRSPWIVGRGRVWRYSKPLATPWPSVTRCSQLSGTLGSDSSASSGG
jgi:hypothetical protein